MNLKIITQEKVVFDSDVDEIYTKGTDGEFAILKGHIPIMAALDIGVTRIKKGNQTKAFTTMGGVLQFKDEECLILTTAFFTTLILLTPSFCSTFYYKKIYKTSSNIAHKIVQYCYLVI